MRGRWRGRSNRTPTHGAAAVRSESTEPGAAAAAAGGEQLHTGQQRPRSGGAEAEAPFLPAGPRAAFCGFTSSSLRPRTPGAPPVPPGRPVSMKKSSTGKRGLVDSAPQNAPPDKVGWIRKFCGRGIFREIWKNRFVVLRGDQLFICEKEVKELGRADEVLDLSDYERCEEIRKNKSRSKKNHSKFRLQRCSSPGNTVPNLVFLAVSPEEKESWINVLSAAITRAKNRILDEVTVQDSHLSHLTRDRVKIPHNRRLPTRGHLLAVASTSSSDGTLILDLIQEEDPAPPRGVDLDKPASLLGSQTSRPPEASGKSQSLPREVVVVWEHPGPGQTPPLSASMDQILTHSETKDASSPASSSSCSSSTAAPPPGRVQDRVQQDQDLGRVQDLIVQKLEKTERLLKEVRAEAGKEAGGGARTEAQRLLKEATEAWTQAHQVLEEVKELRALYRHLDPSKD